MTFDTSNLFSVDNSRAMTAFEGGGRANVGVQATTQFDQGARQGNVRAVLSIVRSELIRGSGRDQYRRRFRSRDPTLRLCSPAPKYSPNKTYTFSVRTRLDQGNLSVQRFEAEGRANFDRWSVSLMYGDLRRAAGLGGT